MGRRREVVRSTMIIRDLPDASDASFFFIFSKRIVFCRSTSCWIASKSLGKAREAKTSVTREVTESEEAYQSFERCSLPIDHRNSSQRWHLVPQDQGTWNDSVAFWSRFLLRVYHCSSFLKARWHRSDSQANSLDDCWIFSFNSVWKFWRMFSSSTKSWSTTQKSFHFALIQSLLDEESSDRWVIDRFPLRVCGICLVNLRSSVSFRISMSQLISSSCPVQLFVCLLRWSNGWVRWYLRVPLRPRQIGTSTVCRKLSIGRTYWRGRHFDSVRVFVHRARIAFDHKTKDISISTTRKGQTIIEGCSKMSDGTVFTVVCSSCPIFLERFKDLWTGIWIHTHEAILQTDENEIRLFSTTDREAIQRQAYSRCIPNQNTGQGNIFAVG